MHSHKQFSTQYHTLYILSFSLGQLLLKYFFAVLNFTRWQIRDIKLLAKIYYSLHIIVRQKRKAWN